MKMDTAYCNGCGTMQPLKQNGAFKQHRVGSKRRICSWSGTKP